MSTQLTSESSLPLTIAVDLFRSSPPLPMDHKHPQSEPPASGQRESVSTRRASSADTERPPSAQRVNMEADAEDANDNDIERVDSNDDPAEQIDGIDWRDLEERYHKAMGKCNANEAALLEEWRNLMEFFHIWAAEGHAHETDRTFRRLRTRVTHVQNSEAQLEATRLHYINVVKAFESALALLNQVNG
ncbi:hypothetical protein P154DRAFT_226991 [Amniculicola lignicola CBS 123094]|uniref:Uncharacterized protein n=1 Tax=Amniculicola lignicola CBS 123094 TaxID=1392246 RepID=A0A6A5WPF6_9PLEO|nr:hypothetical protein P154DRAFT_226991 [Amniculicola lignicola CBS 123094]